MTAAVAQLVGSSLACGVSGFSTKTGSDRSTGARLVIIVAFTGPRI